MYAQMDYGKSDKSNNHVSDCSGYFWIGQYSNFLHELQTYPKVVDHHDDEAMQEALPSKCEKQLRVKLCRIFFLNSCLMLKLYQMQFRNN